MVVVVTNTHTRVVRRSPLLVESATASVAHATRSAAAWLADLPLPHAHRWRVGGVGVAWRRQAGATEHRVAAKTATHFCRAGLASRAAGLPAPHFSHPRRAARPSQPGVAPPCARGAHRATADPVILPAASSGVPGTAPSATRRRKRRGRAHAGGASPQCGRTRAHTATRTHTHTCRTAAALASRQRALPR